MEWIDYHARIGEDGKSESLASFSTQRPRGTNYRKSSGKAALELLSREGNVLVKETVSISAPPQCHNFEPGDRFAKGRVPLLDGAASLRLIEGKTVLHEQRIGAAPKIKLDWPHSNVDRSRPVPLKLTLSAPSEDALLLLGLEWKPGRIIGLGAQRPAQKIQIDFGALPGGPACKLHVTYTSGLRSARATTKAFALAPAKITGKILQPRPEQKFVNDELLVLEADVSPADQVANDEIEWQINGRPVAAGRHAVLNGIKAGDHKLILVVRETRLDTVMVKV